MMRLILSVLATFLFTASVFAATGKGECDAIGVAWRTADGGVTLRLNAHGANGATGESELHYPPSDPHFSEIMARIGPIGPGETVPVCPWPNPPAPKPHP